MICPNCHREVADGVKFCGFCGASMPTTGPSQQPYSSNPNPYGPPPSSNPYGPPQGQYRNVQPPEGSYIPPNQYEEYSSSLFGNSVPKAELHNPKGPIRVGDMTISIDGELVPVVDIMLGNQLPIYFEHHILLWKHPGVQIGFKSMRGMAKRFCAGIQIFLTEAQGPGHTAFSRESGCQMVALRLQPGQTVGVRGPKVLVAARDVE